MNWTRYNEYQGDKTDSYCWAEIRRNPPNSHTSYVTMCYWWEGNLFDADDGFNVSIEDIIHPAKVVGVMAIEKPKPTFVPTDNVRSIGKKRLKKEP